VSFRAGKQAGGGGAGAGLHWLPRDRSAGLLRGGAAPSTLGAGARHLARLCARRGLRLLQLLPCRRPTRLPFFAWASGVPHFTWAAAAAASALPASHEAALLHLGIGNSRRSWALPQVGRQGVSPSRPCRRWAGRESPLPGPAAGGQAGSLPFPALPQVGRQEVSPSRPCRRWAGRESPLPGPAAGGQAGSLPFPALPQVGRQGVSPSRPHRPLRGPTSRAVTVRWRGVHAGRGNRRPSGPLFLQLPARVLAPEALLSPHGKHVAAALLESTLSRSAPSSWSPPSVGVHPQLECTLSWSALCETPSGSDLPLCGPKLPVLCCAYLLGLHSASLGVGG